MFERIPALVEGMTPDSRRSVPALNSGEFSRRIRQLEYLLERATNGAVRASNLTSGDEAGFKAAQEVAMTYAEAFYLFAWRVRTALSRGNALGAFNPEGVNRVRNLLIEHPEDGGPPLPTWMLSGDGDVRLALGGEWAEFPSTARRGPYRDAGLLANAAEFATQLEAFLERHQRPDTTSRWSG